MLLKTEQDTLRFANKVAKKIKWPAVIALHGDLGVGKTTFVRGFIQSLCGDIPVPSPTFTLLQSYESPQGKIIHLDLYRLSDPEELQELGLEEFYDSAVIFIEWPEKADLPADTQTLFFEHTAKGLNLSGSFLKNIN